mmetsp:Transcript_35876/g.111462  ORF Transcript_35876/g.111462 Transcript_35876/m.111462 type:complete len:367 (-) Transcript_35876:1193-2293(-)
MHACMHACTPAWEHAPPPSALLLRPDVAGSVLCLKDGAHMTVTQNALQKQGEVGEPVALLVCAAWVVETEDQHVTVPLGVVGRGVDVGVVKHERLSGPPLALPLPDLERAAFGNLQAQVCGEEKVRVVAVRLNLRVRGHPGQADLHWPHPLQGHEQGLGLREVAPGHPEPALHEDDGAPLRSVPVARGPELLHALVRAQLRQHGAGAGGERGAPRVIGDVVEGFLRLQARDVGAHLPAAEARLVALQLLLARDHAGAGDQAREAGARDRAELQLDRAPRLAEELVRVRCRSLLLHPRGHPQGGLVYCGEALRHQRRGESQRHPLVARAVGEQHPPVRRRPPSTHRHAAVLRVLAGLCRRRSRFATG